VSTPGRLVQKGRRSSGEENGENKVYRVAAERRGHQEKWFFPEWEEKGELPVSREKVEER